MWAYGVEVLAPSLDQNLGLTKAGEDLQVEHDKVLAISIATF